MKKNNLLIFLFCTFFGFSQQKAILKFENKNSKINMYNQLTKTNETKTLAEAENKFGTISENISFGLSLGFNNSLEDLKEAQVSPIDNTIIVTKAQKTSFILSTVISVPISFNNKKAYRFIDNQGNQMGQVHKISQWSIIGIVNLATLQGAQSGTVFNQKLSGGLGLSYSFSEDFSIGLSYELLSYRKPKDFLLAAVGEEIQSNGTTLTTIEISNNDYYYDRYADTIAFKIIYKLTK